VCVEKRGMETVVKHEQEREMVCPTAMMARTARVVRMRRVPVARRDEIVHEAKSTAVRQHAQKTNAVVVVVVVVVRCLRLGWERKLR
jgi:hypothetical protein